MKVEHKLKSFGEGLAKCIICGAAEGEIPTECPERYMTLREREDVYRGVIDFQHGMWVLRPEKRP